MAELWRLSKTSHASEQTMLNTLKQSWILEQQSANQKTHYVATVHLKLACGACLSKEQDIYPHKKTKKIRP